MGRSFLSLLEFFFKMCVVCVSVWWGKSAFALWVLENELGSSGLAASTFVCQPSCQSSRHVFGPAMWLGLTVVSALMLLRPRAVSQPALAMSPQERKEAQSRDLNSGGKGEP